MILWKPGANGQPSPSQAVLAAVDGKIVAIQPLGYSVILDPALMKPDYAAYQVEAPLTRVWGDDDPAAPTQTVQLAFADEASALLALAGLWTGTPE